MKPAAMFGLIVLGAAMAAARPPGPEIGLNPASLTIDAPVGGPNPAPSTVVLKNTGGGKLKWHAASNAAWLSVSPTDGTLRSNETTDLSVGITVAGLAAGTYAGKITVSDSGATNSPQEVTVTLRVSAAARLGLNPASLSFSAPKDGPNPPAQNVVVQNTGGGSLSWTASFVPSWLQGAPASGSLSAGAGTSLSLSVDVTGLAAGTYGGTLTVSAAGVSNSPQSVAVTLTVSQDPMIGLSPTTLAFDAPAGGANPPSKIVGLTNQGGGSLGWSASPSAAWLSVAPSSGSLGPGLGQSLTVSVDTGALVEDTYTGTITIAAAGASNTPATLAVTLNVNAQPKIGLNPKTLAFSVPSDGGLSLPAGLSITNAGTGTLAWTLGGGAPWLSATPAGGSLTALASQPVLISVQAAGLTPGVYTTTMQVDDPQASNSPQTVAVELTVTEPSLPVSAPAGQCGLIGLEAVLLVLRRRRGGTR